MRTNYINRITIAIILKDTRVKNNYGNTTAATYPLPVHGRELCSLFGTFLSPGGVTPHTSISRKHVCCVSSQGVPTLVLINIVCMSVCHLIDSCTTSFKT